MIFVVNKNIPNEMYQCLCAYGRIIKTKQLMNIEGSLALHTDIQLHKASDDTAFCPPEVYEYYRRQLPAHIKLYMGNKNPDRTYPGDCAYNISQFGKNVIANTKSADKIIMKYYTENGYNIIHVNQGYAACNIQIIGNTLLTEDVGIHNIITVNNIAEQSVLLPKGEVILEGFPYGFIGGTAGVADNKLYWYGSAEKCSYSKILRETAKKEGIENIFLSDTALHDFGGIVCFPGK